MPIIVKYYPSLFGQRKKVKERYVVDENGVKQGLYQSYYRNGQEHVTCWYKDNEKQGRYTSKHPNGRIATDCFYQRNDLEGPYSIFYETGVQEFSGNFHQNLGEGKQTWFRPDGTTAYYEHQHRGKREGRSASFGVDDVLRKVFHDGVEAVSQAFSGTSTEIVQDFHNNRMTEQIQYIFDAEHRLIESIVTTPDGYSVHTTYFANRKPQAIWKEFKGSKEGLLIRNFESGRRAEECPYTHNEIDGRRILFYDNAKNTVKEESDYTRGVMNGMIIERDESGRVIGKHRCIKGKRIILRHMSELRFYKMADHEERSKLARKLVEHGRNSQHKEARLLAQQFHSEQSDIPRRTALKFDSENCRS